MSTIPNHTSSERSTAHDDVAMNNGAGRRQDGTDNYSEHPSSIHDIRHGGPASSGNGPPHGAVRPTVQTARDSMYHNEQGYMTSAHDTERGGPPVTPHVSYSSNGSFSSQPPPSHSGGSRPAPLPQPPIATLESNSPTTSTSSSQTLKKRKSMYDPPHVSHSPTAPSPSTSASPATPSAMPTAQQTKESVKRTKTSRACDPCRRKKIRCDILQTSEPPICAHCKQYGFDCTFFLPITETRWKKRKAEEDESSSQPPAHKPAPATVAATTSSASSSRPATRSDPISNVLSSFPLRRENSDTSTRASTSAPRGENTRIYGPTSLTYILHSSSTMPAVDSFDLRYHQTWRVGRSGEGFIQIHEQDDPNMPNDDDNLDEDGKSRSIEREVLQSLINYYFQYISPVFPVITESEFIRGTSEDRERAGSAARADNTRTQTHEPTPVLLYAICTLAATARHVPFRVFDALRIMLNTVIRSDDVLSTATLSNIQALLIAGMTAEAHGRVPSQAMSAAFIRTSTAIRMAQDLGLHRAEAVKTDLDLRRRLWAACVIQDRWYALQLGLPFIIDVQDCDARLPRPEIPAHLLQHGLSPEVAREAKSLLFMGEFVRLSVLMGRMTKAIYSPTGLIHTTDETLETLQYELETFMQKAPPELVLRDNTSDVFAGLLHLCHTAVGLVFWRVFARIQYTIPAHLKFAITVEAWTSLTVESAKAIRWLEQAQNEIYYDSLMMVSYSLTSCALVQYHTWARRSDEEAQDNLKRARDLSKRWEAKVEAGHMLTRRKTTEIISLLFEATTSPVPRNFWPLNPTAGVEARNSAQADAIVFRKDPSRRGGGMFIATQRTASALGEDIPDGTLVVPDVPDMYAAGPSRSGQHSSADTSMDGSGMGHHGGSMMGADSGGYSQNGDNKGVSLGGMPMMGVHDDSSRGGMPNMNPGMGDTDPTYGVQMMNPLHDHSGNLASYAAAANTYLETLPEGNFDFDNWATYFSKLAEYQQALAADKSQETPAPTDHSPTDQNDQPETPPTLP